MWRSTPAKIVAVENDHYWHRKDPLAEELGIIRSVLISRLFNTMESTALLKFLPEDGSPNKFPITCGTTP